jgi:hypothetical protein
METLGNDLTLLSIRLNGVIGTAAKLGFGLSGSELVRLTEIGRVDVEDGLIIIHDEAPTGDALLGVAGVADRIAPMSATPATSPIGVNGVGDRSRLGSMA